MHFWIKSLRTDCNFSCIVNCYWYQMSTQVTILFDKTNKEICDKNENVNCKTGNANLWKHAFYFINACLVVYQQTLNKETKKCLLHLNNQKLWSLYFYLFQTLFVLTYSIYLPVREWSLSFGVKQLILKKSLCTASLLWSKHVSKSRINVCISAKKRLFNKAWLRYFQRTKLSLIAFVICRANAF